MDSCAVKTLGAAIPAALALLAAVVGLVMVIDGHLVRGLLTPACALPIFAEILTRQRAASRQG
jgi:hypothetical protein